MVYSAFELLTNVRFLAAASGDVENNFTKLFLTKISPKAFSVNSFSRKFHVTTCINLSIYSYNCTADFDFRF